MRRCVRMSKKIFALVLTVLTLLFVCVGCDSSSVEPDESQATVYVKFYDDTTQSRGVNVKDEQLPASKVENLYWTYKAEKLAGLYTIGETSDEKPVKPGPAKGLTGNVGPFSVGKWKFTINGYENSDCTSASLVYSGTANATLEIGAPSTEVFFEVADRRTGIGRLTFGSMSMTIPGGQWLSYEAGKTTKVRVTATVKQGGTVKATAECSEDVLAPKQAGDSLNISALSFVSPSSGDPTFENLPAGSYTLEFKADYHDEYNDHVSPTVEWFPIGTLSNYNLMIHGGMKTTVSGDINNAIFNRGDMEPEGFNVGSVARIGTGSSAKYYPSLEEASKDAATSGQTIVLLADIGPNSVHTQTDKLHTSATSVTVDPNGHFIDKLTIGSGKTLTIQIGAKTYAISGGVLTNFSYAGSNVSITTDGVTSGGVTSVTVDATGDTVYHAGTMASSGTVTVTNASSYKLATSGTISSVSISAGNLIISGSAKIATLSVPSGFSGTIKGSNLQFFPVSEYECNGLSLTESGKPKLFTTEQAAGPFKQIKLDGNGGTLNGEIAWYIYGIEGTYIDLPAFTFSYTSSTGVAGGFVNWKGSDNTIYDDKGRVLVKTGGDTITAQWYVPSAP
mgnify:CR=1 FL=1